MTGRQIPGQIWPSVTGPDLSEFMKEAGLTAPQEDQQFLCFACVAEGNETPPTKVIFVKGTSFCIEHGKNMLD